ncbi:electron transfer flavoprotein subunit beta, partial [Klebsiella pneumoniae]|nr:electron transfer flavoprotein subunit beta [Klebsiella pneumoniae]
MLLRSMELGADEGILVTDRKFAGADTWVTAFTLAESIRYAVPDFDLVLVGKQAIDGDTAQVGPEIAEILGLPQITYGV